MSLEQERCTACRQDAPRVTPEEHFHWSPHIPHWSVEEEHGVRRLERSFTFANFQQALNFTVEVGRLAEEENHHPAILTEWGRVTVRWWTHKIGGLHRNDYICAAKTDRLYR